MKDTTKKEVKSWGKSIIIAIGIAFIARTFFFAPYIVEGASMEPTLHDQEKIFVSKLKMNTDYQRGDIIIIKGKEKNYVKRIIGLPGEKIFMKNDQLYINGVVYKEPYLSQNLKLAFKAGGKLTGDFGPINVPRNKFFVMGDNRLKSEDSRNGLGYIRKQSIIGKGEFVIFPFTKIRNVE